MRVFSLHRTEINELCRLSQEPWRSPVWLGGVVRRTRLFVQTRTLDRPVAHNRGLFGGGAGYSRRNGRARDPVRQTARWLRLLR